ncbi:MAG: TolC family protein [Bacteroidales bacterium]
MFHSSRIAIACLLQLLICHPGMSQVCTLSDYIDNGVKHSPVLQDLSSQILLNQYDSLISRASYLPQVNFNGLMMYAPVINDWGYSDVITNGQNLIGTINVNQDIFNKKNREAHSEKYGLESGKLKNAKNISLNELKKAITAQYLAAYAAREELTFQEEILSSLKNEAAILKAWTEKGIYRQTDYLSMQVEMLNLGRNIRDLDLQYRREWWNLNLICGIGDTVLCDLALPVIHDNLGKTEENSIFFRSFVIDSLVIKNEKLLIDRRYKPVVSWFADGGLINNEPQYLYQNLGISAGLSMTLPIFDGNQRKFNYQKIRMQEETRKNYQDNFRFRYHSQLRQLQSELETTRRYMQENEKQISLSHELVAADKILLNTGAALITDYILAIKNLIEAKHAGLVYQIRTQYILNEINFWKQ